MSTTVRRATTISDIFVIIEKYIELPEFFKDPITLEIMLDPVVANDGVTYNRTTADEMIKNKSRSSIGVNVTSYVTNRIIKVVLNEMLKSYGIDLELIIENDKRSRETIITITEEENKSPSFKLETSKEDMKTCHVYIIDVSGSMEIDSGINELNVNRLDVVKYALFLSVKAINQGDEIVIVSFNSTSRSVVDLTVVTDRNRQSIINSVMLLNPNGTTNILSGLSKGIELSSRRSSENVFYHIFTDGEDDNPANIERNYRAIINVNENVDNNIALYGFSSAVDINCIKSMKKDIPFYFISDTSMLITSFFNGFSNANSRKTIETDEMFDMVNRLAINDLSKVMNQASGKSRALTLASLTNTLEETKEFILKQTDRNIDLAINFIDNLLLDLMESLETSLGQIDKAADHRYFDKWGRAYLFSYVNALINKICINYKDNGLKVFITPRRKLLIEKCEEIVEKNTFTDFISSFNSNQQYGRQRQVNIPRSLRLYDDQGGCFTGDSIVTIIDENHNIKKIKVCEIQDNMSVLTDMGFSKIILKTRIFYSGKVYKLQNENFYLTPYHPIMISDQSSFPIDSLNEVIEFSGYVYDLAVENRGLLDISGKYVASLNHNCDNGTFKHDYYSTDKVQEDVFSILTIIGRSNFEVELFSTDILRRESDNQVCGLDINSIIKRNCM